MATKSWRDLYSISPQQPLPLFGDEHTTKRFRRPDIDQDIRRQATNPYSRQRIPATVWKTFTTSRNSPLFEFMFCAGKRSARSRHCQEDSPPYSEREYVSHSGNTLQNRMDGDHLEPRHRLYQDQLRLQALLCRAHVQATAGHGHGEVSTRDSRSSSMSPSFKSL